VSQAVQPALEQHLLPILSPTDKGIQGGQPDLERRIAVQPPSSPTAEKIHDLAQRYGISPDAVRTLLQALIASNGNAAQFNHPELGGAGQWMRGGMTMISNPSDTNLRSRVEGLCSELSLFLAQPSFQATVTSVGGFHEAEDPRHPPVDPLGEPVLTAGSWFGNWWPAELGVPAATGRQDETRYAYFPDSGRLVVAGNGRTTVYNTAGHRITGVAQQQQDGAPLTFTSSEGPIRAVDLPVISVTEEVAHPVGPVAD
jgi:hypothetical protein